MYPYMTPYNQPKQEIIKVNGIQGANALMLPPNSSALVIDMNAPIVYLCVTDGAGLKTVTSYSITEYKPEDEFKTLSDRIAKLEEIINDKSNAKPIEPQQPNSIDEFRELIKRQS